MSKFQCQFLMIKTNQISCYLVGTFSLIALVCTCISSSWCQVCFSCICLFVLHVLVIVLCRGLAAVCDCGTPWTFLLTLLLRLVIWHSLNFSINFSETIEVNIMKQANQSISFCYHLSCKLTACVDQTQKY